MKTQSKLLAAGLALGLVLCTVQATKQARPTPNDLRALINILLNKGTQSAESKQALQGFTQKYDINALDDVGEHTLLTMTIAQGAHMSNTPDIIKLLVTEYGANINTKNDRGNTPLDVAKSVDDMNVITTLVDLGVTADAETLGKIEELKKQRAAWNEMVRKSLEKAKEKFDPAKAPTRAYDEIYPQIVKKDWDGIRNFIENNNIDVNTILTGKSVEEPLFGFILRRKGYSYEKVNEMLDYFIKHGGNINVHSKDGITLLHCLALPMSYSSEMTYQEFENYGRDPQNYKRVAATKVPAKIVQKFIDLGFTGINTIADVKLGGNNRYMGTPLDRAYSFRRTRQGNIGYNIPNWYELALVQHGALLSENRKLWSPEKTRKLYDNQIRNLSRFQWFSSW